MPADNFNAGVMSLTPSETTFNLLLNLTTTHTLGWDAEQGLLNSFFPAPSRYLLHPAKHTRTVLPMKYNLNLEALRSHPVQWNDVWPDARIVHFTVEKPSSGTCKLQEERCKFVQPLTRWREEFLEMRQSAGWHDLEVNND
jgi:glycogenin glucosyltransferase